jgi:hypothetical protein
VFRSSFDLEEEEKKGARDKLNGKGEYIYCVFNELEILLFGLDSINGCVFRRNEKIYLENYFNRDIVTFHSNE